jgi:hypothetical protein
MEQGPSEKLIVPQPVKKFPTFMEPTGSLMNSKEEVKCLYPEPDQSSPSPLPHFLKIHSYISIVPWMNISTFRNVNFTFG